MQKITFRKLAGEKYIYPELQGHFIEFLGSCIYDGIWVGEALSSFFSRQKDSALLPCYLTFLC